MKEGEICFENCICIYKESKSKGKGCRKKLDLLKLLIAISKWLVESILKEKEVSIGEADI